MGQPTSALRRGPALTKLSLEALRFSPGPSWTGLRAEFNRFPSHGFCGDSAPPSLAELAQEQARRARLVRTTDFASLSTTRSRQDTRARLCGRSTTEHQRKAILCRETDHRARTPQATYLRGRDSIATWDNWRVVFACGSAYRSRRFAGLGVQAAQPTPEPLELPDACPSAPWDLGGNRKLRSISCNFALSAQRPLFLLALTTLSFTQPSILSGHLF